MKTQTPLYRAKKIDSNEYYIGYLTVAMNGAFMLSVIEGKRTNWRTVIDPATLSISFPDMLDSKGTRIFASLSEDGKGGDIVNIFGKGLCCLTFDIDGIQAHIINNTANIFDDIFPFSEALMEKDVGTVAGIKS